MVLRDHRDMGINDRPLIRALEGRSISICALAVESGAASHHQAQLSPAWGSGPRPQEAHAQYILPDGQAFHQDLVTWP